MNELIAKLDEYRLEHRITQGQLADNLGVALITVSRWLNGHTNPNKIQEFHIRKLLSKKGTAK